MAEAEGPPQQELKNPTIEAPPNTTLALDRQNERKEKFKNEKIEFRMRDSNGNEPEGCQWRITRVKVTAKLVQEMISRSPLPGKLDFVQEVTSGEVLFPENMMLQCKPLPFSYIINLRKIRFAEDVYDDPHFAGYMQVVLRDVPRHCRNGKDETTAEALKLWLAYGLKEEHPVIRRLASQLGKTKEEIDKLVKVMKRIPKVKPHDAKGNTVKGDEADHEREMMRERALKEKEELEQQLIEEQEALDNMLQRLIDMDFTVERVEEDTPKARYFNTWYVTFGDVEDTFAGDGEDEYFDLEAAFLNKSDWNGINLAVGFWTRDHEGIKKFIQPWAGRGNIPDGHKEFIPDYTNYDVNMRGVQILRVAHGIGMYKSLDKRGVDFFGPMFSVYHGMWKEGVRHGFGQQFDDTGHYSGFWEFDRRRGQGHTDYPHGSSFKGEFGVRKHHKAGSHAFDVLPNNPYADGLPNDLSGKAVYRFPDGSGYEGQVVDGKITGHGRYVNAMGEQMEGEFRNGLLHGKGTKVDVLGRKYEGTWRDGQLHGDGVFTSPDRDVYRGSWFRNERHGWGYERYRNGNHSYGFYTHDERHGHGVMNHGHVRERYDTTTGRTIMKSRMRFEGFFLAGNSAGRGLNTYCKYGNRYYTSNSRDPDKKQFLENLKTIRTGNEAKWRELLAKYQKLDLTLRRDMTRRKTHIFVSQRRSAKEALLADSEHPYSQKEFEGSLELRAGRVAAEIESKRVSEADAEQRVASNPVSDGAAKLVQLARETNQLDFDGKLFKPPIVNVIQSDFEEAEERRRFMNYEKIKEKAKRKIQAQERVEAMRK